MKKNETGISGFKDRMVPNVPSSFSFSAFTTLYNNTIDQLYSYGTKITSDKSLIKDCIQEVFIDVFVNWEKIRNPKSIKFYLLKALNHTICRKLNTRRQNDFFDVEIMEDQFSEQSFEEKIIKKEEENSRDKKIQKVLDELTPKLKEILFLRFNMGFTYQEIGHLMGINSESAKKQTHRALNKLRELLDKSSL
jgi:RNA polymerase sigma-70 factor (ECF subfamily)